MLNGKKTYILIGLALLGALATYSAGVVNNGFDIGEFWKFIQSEAVVAAIATLRMAIAKSIMACISFHLVLSIIQSPIK